MAKAWRSRDIASVTAVVERICRPLGMDSTRLMLTPQLKARLATGHDPLGHAFPGLHSQSLMGGSGLRSRANDLLKSRGSDTSPTANLLTQPTHGCGTVTTEAAGR